ncbi:MAG: CCA tRNA nucleotidyltransferase [Candidatus Omnitrophica bacterium]|nr:CCA tRNA nucleotidyltransferase [Candidatus Omnitrophota bacterium]
MKVNLKNLPPKIQDLIHLASDIAYKNNTPAYLVGGFVRDLLLGVKNLDLDIVVEAEGIGFAEELQRILKTKLICHKRFGTATIILKDNSKIDIATTRKEIYPQPGSLPIVTQGDLRDDLARRDFTINAMAISINQKDYGRLIDFFGGISDLKEKRIRILHDLSFIDDPTRILRAIRFEKRYEFQIEAQTLSLLKEAVRLNSLKNVHPHRLRDELILILKEDEPLKPIKRIQRLVGFRFVHPDLCSLKLKERLLYSIQKEISWFNQNYPRRRPLDNWLIYLMGLCEPLGVGAVREFIKDFALRAGEAKRILDSKLIKPKFILRLKQKKLKAEEIFRLLEPLSYEVIIFISAKYKNRNLKEHIKDFFDIYNGMRILISGDDLKRLGILPGPFYQKIFTEVLNAKLKGEVKTKEEELFLIKELIKKR